jgi:hypothetical protein
VVLIESDSEKEAVVSNASENKENASAAADGTNWFQSLDQETRQQLAEARKLEGNQLFAKACYLQASKKYSEVRAFKNIKSYRTMLSLLHYFINTSVLICKSQNTGNYRSILTKALHTFQKGGVDRTGKGNGNNLNIEGFVSEGT